MSGTLAVSTESMHRLEQSSEKPKSSNKLPQKNSIDVVVGFVAEKWDTFFKVIYTGVDWAKYFDVIPKEHQQLAGDVRRTANIIKLGHGPVEFVENTHKFFKSAHNAVYEPTAKNLFKAAIDLNGCYSPAFDTIELLSKTVINIPAETFQTLEGINGATLIIGMTNQTREAVEKIADSNLVDAKTPGQLAKRMRDVTQALLDMAKAVSYVALGIFVVLAIFFNIIAPGVVFLALSTSALVFTILGYYHKNIGMPIEPKKPDFCWVGAR